MKVDEKETFGDSVHAEHTEIFKVLNWLKEKKVNEIIELTVPDRLVNPHDEVKIGKYVRNFEVEVLNWRFLDMSISIFEDPKTRERIRELHLYSSGKRAVISHWLSEEGVASLPNVCPTSAQASAYSILGSNGGTDQVARLAYNPRDIRHTGSGCIASTSVRRLLTRTFKELMTKENCRKTVDFIREKFNKVSHAINKARECEPREDGEKREELKVNVNPQLWNPTHERVADLEEM